MTDHVTREKRSEIMRSVKQRGTTPELIVRSVIYRLGYRYRLNAKNIPGKPDVALTKHRKAIFVHGCFWHGHPHCRYARIPKSNADYWKEKRRLNRKRDKRIIDLLQKTGWKTLVIWQCETKDLHDLEEKIKSFLSKE